MIRKKSHPLTGIIFTILIFILLNPLQAENDSLLTLKRIFSDHEFSTERIGQTRWLDDGKGYTTLEKSADAEGRDIVYYDCASGERSVLVPATMLIPDDQEKPLRIADYHWSPDRDKLLIFTNTRKVWRYHTRGDYWIVDLADSAMKQLGGDAEPATLMFATFSPDGKQVAYVIENNLYVENLADHSIMPLTTSGSETIINGTFDWVYEEEFSNRKGFRWSPDSKKIAYWQLDAKGVGVFNLINNIDSIYSRVIPVQYPKTGTTNSACRAGVVDLKSGETTWFQIPGDPRNHYLARMEWAASSDAVIIQQLNRQQNTNRVFLADPATGKAENIFTDRDSAWVEVVDDLHWLDDGSAFTWISERDGWKHLYRVSRSGKEIKLLTPGDYDVINLLGIDQEKGWLYYIAAPDNPTLRYLFRRPLDGSGTMERLTPAKLSGTNSYKIAPDFRNAFHTHSSINTPPTISLIRLPEHETVRVMEDNQALRDKLAKLKRRPADFFRIDIGDGILLDGYRILPPDFDPQKKYPLLFYVYGEPAGQTVRDAWGYSNYLWHTYLAQQGYIVMSIDNRGTSAPRGREWRKCIYRRIGILASADQAAAARKIRQWDYVDSTRIAIWGWSGGGSMSLNAIFRYPELYQTAMAIAFISDQRLYDTIYQERYMDTPQNNPEGYRDGSPITHAHNLEGNLLLIHGTLDDNCHYQSMEMLIDELIAHNKMFTTVPYPNRTHSIYRGKNTRRHLFETLTWYLKNHVQPGGLEK